jgi:Protein of unknown function (DUF2786)
MISIDPIIEKIKKLLRMKRGGTPDEVATALRLAQELAEKHGINLGDVDENDERSNHEKPISHTDALIAARIQWECKYAALVCQQFFNVTVMVRRSFKRLQHDLCLTFIGTEWDTQIALYIYHLLVGHFRREWKTKRGRLRNRQAFMYGMYIGLCSKLEERQPKKEQTPGIVTTDRGLVLRKDYMEKNFGKTESTNVQPDGDAAAAKYAGYVSGRNTEIRGGVKNGESNKASLVASTIGQLLLE